MLKNPFVSFVVTSYNYENFIGKTLDSIKNQFVMLKGIKAGFDAPKRISMNAF